MWHGFILPNVAQYIFYDVYLRHTSQKMPTIVQRMITSIAQSWDNLSHAFNSLLGAY